MNPIKLEDILNCPSVPSLPSVAVRVLELTSDPDVELDELAKEIQFDQGIASKILRTVNSSFYGLRKRCASIEHALIMLGLGPVKSLVLGFSLVLCVNDQHKEQISKFDYLSYWKRGLTTGVAAKFAAELVSKQTEPDEAFLAGLFQDIGMVAMYRTLGDEYIQVLEQTEGDHTKLSKFELNTLEIQHATVGALLCEKWKIPHEIVLPVRYHDHPTACPQEYSKVARCVGIGNMIHELLESDDPTELLRKVYSKAHSWLGFTETQVDELIKKSGDTTKELGNLFSIDVGTVPDPEEVLSKADRQLIDISKSEQIVSYTTQKLSEVILTDGDTDPMTGLLGRKSFNSAIRAAYDSFKDDQIPLSLCQLLISGYEDLGKTIGLQAQDELGICLSVMLQREFEPMGGVIFRLSEAIFGVVLPNVDREQTLVHTQSACEEFSKRLFEWIPDIDGTEGLVNAYFGVASVDASSSSVIKSPELLVEAASRAVGAAKMNKASAVRAFVPQRKAA